MPTAYDVTAWGAGLTALYAPLKPGESEPFNILISFPRNKMYETHPHGAFLHQTVGRTTNRIANARIEDLNGKTYELAANNGPNNLHGGKVGWSTKAWEDHGHVKRAYESQAGDCIEWTGEDGAGNRDAREFTLTSPDGDEGFPGTVQAKCWYSEGKGSKGENVVEIEWEAELVEPDIETVVGMTNHAYFNLNPASKPSEKSLKDHSARLATSKYLTIRDDLPGIPTGNIDFYPGIPKAPFNSFPLDEDGKLLDVDDCFIVDEEAGNIPTDTRKWPLQTLAEIHGNQSGIHLAVESTEPAFQFYTGKYINVPAWDAGSDGDSSWEAGDGYKTHSALCVEPSRYVNAAGNKDWRSMCLLKKGQPFGAKARYVISRT